MTRPLFDRPVLERIVLPRPVLSSPFLQRLAALHVPSIRSRIMNTRQRRAQALARWAPQPDTGLPSGFTWETLTSEQLERMAYGEDPVRVLRGDPRIPPSPEQVAELARMDALFATLTDTQLQRIADGESLEAVLATTEPR